MTIDISAETPRVQYTVTSADSTFDYDFEIFQDSDIKVFVDSTLKTLTTHYTVSGAGTTGGGTVTMTSGNAVTNATVTLVRDITIQRTTDFPSSGAFQVESLNTELDRITAVQQTLEDNISRSLRLADEDATSTLTLPLKDARKGRYLAFNATTGNAEAGPTQTDATAIASVTSDIALLADIQDGTTATNALTNLANIHGNVTTVAGIHGNVTTVAGKANEITTIATGTTGGNSNLTNLNTIATGTTGGNANLTQINAVATNATNINTVASADSNISAITASGVISNIGTVAGIAGNVTTVAGQNTNITTLANISSDITSLANSLEKTYTVTVAGGVFVLDGSNNPAIEMFRGNAYIFNQNDATNDGHPLVFKNGSSAYQDGVKYYLNGSETSYANYYNTTNFNAGRSSGDRKVIIEVASTAPSSGLRYYCYVHGNGMGNTITVKDSNISLVATNIANVNNVGNNITDVSNVHTNMTKVSNVHTNMSDINALNASGVLTNIGTLATGTTGGNANLTQINTVAGAVNSVNTVATNISGVNSFADRYRVASSAPTSSLDVGDLYFDTTANELKVYKSSGWSAAGSTVNGTSARFHYNITGSTNTVTGADANGNTLAYDAGFIDVYVNGVRMSPDDITITSGTSVVFASNLANGDDVDIVAFGTFQVANIVSTGALNSGSITSGFGNIDTGSSTITTTGAISGGTLTGSTLTGSTSIKTPLIEFTDGDDALTIADGGHVTANANLTVSGTTTINDDLTLTGANYNVTWDKSDNALEFGDNAKANFGASNDLSIYHDGSNTYIDESGTGALFIRSSRVSMHKYTGETMINATADGAVSLYYDDSKKLQTGSSGIEIYNGSTGNNPNIFLKDMNSGVVSGDEGGGLYWYTNDGNGQGNNLAIIQKFENSAGGAGMAFEVGTGSSRDERMRLNTNGQLIMRNASADANACITVRQSVGSGLGGVYIDTYAYYSNIPGINITNGDTNNARNMEDVELHRNGALKGFIRIKHNGVEFTSNSDYRLKEDAKEITNAFEQIKKLKPYNFKWKNSDDRQDGFFAHEIGEVFDYVAQGEKDDTELKKNVVRNKDGFIIAQNIEKADWEKRKDDADNEEASPKGETTYPTDSTWQKEYEDIKPQTVDNSKLVPMLTACLQEAIAKIEILESKVKALEEA